MLLTLSSVRRVGVVLTLSLLALGMTETTQATEPPPGFTTIFNGKDTTGWVAWAIHEKGATPLHTVSAPLLVRSAAWAEDARKHWSVENGELVNDGLGAYLATEKAYGDIELLLEYKTVAKADSGIYLRSTPQVQIWDTTKEGGKWDRNADKGSGGLFNNTKGAPGQIPLEHADKPFGEWNQFRIIQVGERTTVYLNGKLVVNNARMENYWDRSKPLPRVGSILLQTHGGEIRWRNIFIREIPGDEANTILNAAEKDSFQSIFNGNDFTGWAGALENYEIIDGAIVCKPKKGGVIFAQEHLTDFTARAEFKVPPAGNNGFAIRYPGKGRASADAMCEVQVLDDTAPKYAKLDPRQINGSAYGIAAAHPGYLRPVGEWNHTEVTAIGHRLMVELNGTRILDADLSTITSFKDNLPHPGKDRLDGYFGLCGHNDPVAFRNMHVKHLKK